MHLSRSQINFLLDALLLVNFTLLMATAVIVRFVFPPGPDAAGWYLWGYNYQQWSTFQFGVIATLALGILVHLMLHWSWVCGILVTQFTRNKRAKMDEGTQTIVGVGLLIVLLNVVGGAIAIAALTIRSSN
ncbi:hypothetical protein ETAA8_12750 [Anatilimnocola aggregata]|uniref:Flavinylation-associated cytochrome domain-containing protein n=1 Tax=Anatilimnocola aggregata TaxID=2528021 RepID=A0A517Y7I6_9BACT|nr:DUF4405 domain-containing protein [Anatilimnocola aggregata]QDU26200.1 hypothetical protein ETAA8_12750 [Anatilimnocola aggregata]